MLTEQYDINRWFRNFGARPKYLFKNPLNDLLFSHAGLEYRQTYHNGAGITFHSMLLSSPLLVSGCTVPDRNLLSPRGIGLTVRKVSQPTSLFRTACLHLMPLFRP